MLNQLDYETKNMMFEPGERKTTIEEMESKIENTKNSNSLIILAENNGTIVGYLSAERGLAKRINHSAYIHLGILKDYRGKEIGTKLFEELEEWVLKNSISRLELSVMTHNKGGIHLYEKMGFKIEGLKEKSMIVNGKYVDEYYMARIIFCDVNNPKSS